MGITVVIPSKTMSNLEPCVEHVQASEPAARVFVVDDGVAWAERRFPWIAPVLPIQGVKPFVYARNCNLGIRFAGQDDVVLLNDDALLETPGGFGLLQRAALEHPEYGVIASTSNNVGNPNQWPHGTKALHHEPRMVCFVCVLIPRRTIERVGLLDERFTGYGCDDDDYCLRVRNAGLKIGIHDGCYVDHGSLCSTFRGAAGAGGDYESNLRLFREKWGTDNWGRP